MKESKNISNNIYMLRVIAIFLVIMAHVNRNVSTGIDIISKIYSIISMGGVTTFFIIAGYYYKGYDNIKLFLKEKFKKIIIPWVIAGIITYVIHSIKTPPPSLIGMLNWVLGYKTLYYYMTMYLLFIIIFKPLNKNYQYIILIIINILSLILGQYLILKYNVLTPYLNPLNWCGYFAIGKIIKNNSLLKNTNKYMKIIEILLLILLFILCYNTRDINYFNVYSFLFNTIFFKVLYNFTNIFYNRKIAMFGKYTMFIYMYHIQIVQFVCFRLPNISIINIINPFIGTTIMIIIIFLFKSIYEIDSRFNKIIRIIGIDFEKK